MKIYKDQNLEVRFDLDYKILINKFLREHVILKEAAQFTGAIELTSPKAVLLDLSLVKSMEKFAKDIIADDLTMQLKGRGVRKFSLVRSGEQKLNDFILSLMEGDKKPEKLQVREFDSEAEAMAWLREK